jgi:hypothetical protein
VEGVEARSLWSTRPASYSWEVVGVEQCISVQVAVAARRLVELQRRPGLVRCMSLWFAELLAQERVGRILALVPQRSRMESMACWTSPRIRRI